MEFDLEYPLTTLREDKFGVIPILFKAESDHMPSTKAIDDLYGSIRQEGIAVILQARHCYDNDIFIPYLALNYMDRFISSQEFRHPGSWFIRLTGMACLSLAAKMRNQFLSISTLQIKGSFIFDKRTICRMEWVILDALCWRMRSITPFSFLNFFVSMFELKDPPSIQTLKNQAKETLFKAHTEIKLLEFKPSIVAATAVILACHGLYPMQFPTFKRSISSIKFVNNEKLHQCFDVFQEMVKTEPCESILDSTSTTTRTASSVLDQQCSELKDAKKDNSPGSKADSKRRKYNDHGMNR